MPAPPTLALRFLVGLQMSSRPLIPLLLAGAVALACGTRSHSDAPATPHLSTKRVAAKSTTGSTPITSKFHVRADQKKIDFALHLTNPTKKSVELEFPSGQEYDFVVVDSAGHEVYRWANGRLFTQALQNRLLDGGETMRFEERAEKSLPSGKYVAVATLRSSNYPVQERYEFTLQ